MTACSLRSLEHLQNFEEEPSSGASGAGAGSSGTRGKSDGTAPLTGGAGGASDPGSSDEPVSEEPDSGLPGSGSGDSTGGGSQGGSSSNGEAGAAGAAGLAGGSAGGSGQTGCDSSTCLNQIRLSAGAITARRGGSGGTQFVDLCPANEVLIGFTGYVESRGWIESLAGVCGVVALSGPTGTEVSISTSTTLPLRGGNTGTAFSRVCPSGYVIVGFGGRSGLYIDRLVPSCARLSVEEGGSSYRVVLGTSITLSSVGGPGGNPFGSVFCPANELARGTDTRSGDALDSLALNCARPEVVCASGVCP